MSLARRTQDHDWQHARSAWPALGCILLLHVAALWGLMQIESVRTAITEAAPIMVGLITLPPPEPPKPLIQPPPKPVPVTPKPRPQPQMIAAPTPEPAAIAAPLPEPVVVEPPPPPPPAPPSDPAPLPVVPPSFVAAYLDNPAPRYPDSSKRLGESGLVSLRVRVSAQGLPESIEVETSSGFARLDRAAIEAVRRWKFVPARQGDQPVPASVIVPLHFELKNA